MKKKIQKSEKKTKKDSKEITKLEEYKKDISNLNKTLKIKDEEIERLNKELVSLQKNEIAANFEQSDTASSEINKRLKEDLQNKLNRAKLQIKSLQEQIKKDQSSSSQELSEKQNDLDGKLKIQREMAIFLQKQLATKEGEIETIKNEAVQIKRKYRQLENDLKIRDQKISELQRKIDNFNFQPPSQPSQEDPQLALRIRELKNKLDNMEKLNTEQRIEISQLRKPK